MADYPTCPECGERAKHRPVNVESGVTVFYVHHAHDCPVHRYNARIDAEGNQLGAVVLGQGVRAEDRMVVAS